MVDFDEYLVLVNKENVFEPSMLKNYKMVHVKDSDGKTYVEEETNRAYKELAKYMAEKHGIALSLTSAGRTIEQQQKTMDFYIKRDGEESAKKRVATPGQSEHHTGLALDVGVHKIHMPLEQNVYNSQLLIKVVNKLNKPTKEEEAEMYKTLHNELANFGFILRYPDDKKELTGVEIDEPWHIRYVGVENAKAMQDLGMCLEEYVVYLKSQETSVD